MKLQSDSGKVSRAALKPIVRALSILGLRPAALRGAAALRYLPKYWRQAREFRQLGGQITHRYPILYNYGGQAGTASGHYFHQDLLVASLIHNNNPRRHIDVGSRIDGFVAHVAAFRTIEIFDIRPLKHTGHQNISSVQGDLMDDARDLPTADSISCLHAIEHFGLGRYSDPLDPDGYKKGFKNLTRMLEPGGTLYISFPIGKQNEVHFNAHRVFHPLDIFNWNTDTTLRLKRFDFVDDGGELHQDVDLQNTLPNVFYGCGIYTFVRS
jgi:uncharacterized protein DUF268